MASNRPFPNCEKEYRAISKIRDFNIASKTRSNAFSFETVAELLKTSESELQEYDEEIKRLKAKIFALEGRKKKLEGYIVAMRSLLSPIRKLPLDVLGSIFEEAQPVGVIANKKSASPVSAYLFASVCSYWRSLALGMPSLWSNIQLDVDFEWEEQQTNLLTTLLKLSQASLLTLRIECGKEKYIQYIHGSQRRHTAIDKLLEETSRWQEVCFSCPYELLVAVFENFHGIFQELKCLHLACRSISESVTNSSLSVFGTAPCLSQLRLSWLREPLSIAVPYTQITDANLTGVGPDEVLEILRRCSNLIYFNLMYGRSATAPTTVVQPFSGQIFKRNIHSLTISIWTAVITRDDLVSVERVISCVKHPLLSTLTVYSYANNSQVLPWGIIVDAFRSLVSRSQCHIIKLTINNLAIDSSNFLTLLDCLSQLEELNLHHHNVARQILSDAVVSELRVDEASTLQEAVLLPRLRKINLTIASNSLSDGVLLDMIISRSDPFNEEDRYPDVVRLKVVRVCVKDCYIKEDIIESYQDLVSTGLSVTLIDERGTVIA
jgi:hypothetical protein